MLRSRGISALVLFCLACLPAQAQNRQAFATSVAGSGDLSSWPDSQGVGGLAGADAVCQSRASLAGLPNAGLFRAWLGTPVTDPFCHLHGLSGLQSQSCSGQLPGDARVGPWQRRDGASFAGESRALIDEWKVLRPVRFDEFGNTIADDADEYWTGDLVSVGGTRLSCGNWNQTADSATVGSAHAIGWSFSRATTASCSSPRRLLCLEAAEGVLESEPNAGGFVAFVTSDQGNGNISSWPRAQGGSSLAGADTICRNSAAAAFLPRADSFIAWLSIPGFPVPSRINGDEPVVRVDGVQLADSILNLVDPMPDAIDLRTALNVTENGQYIGEQSSCSWTGTDGSGEPTIDHCSLWNSSIPQAIGRGGVLDRGDRRWTDGFGTGCSWGGCHLYCLSSVPILFWDNFEAGDLRRWSLVLESVRLE